jgi:hypothetical protein
VLTPSKHPIYPSLPKMADKTGLNGSAKVSAAKYGQSDPANLSPQSEDD